MESIKYQPAGDKYPHLIIAELTQAENRWMTFLVKSDGREIGEIDVETVSAEESFISGTGPGEEINNGYLKPASLAVAACLKSSNPDFKTLYDIEDAPINPT